jgi:hypothetical protein
VSEKRGRNTPPRSPWNAAANDSQLTQLRYVLCSVGMRELATALALNTTLTRLDLWGRGLVDAAHELAGALERNKTLKTLNYDNNIGPDGARHLAAAHAKLGREQHWVRRRARCLAAALRVLELSLGGNSIEDDRAAALRTALE